MTACLWAHFIDQKAPNDYISISIELFSGAFRDFIFT